MTDNKHPEPDVEFSDKKPLADSKRSSCKTKIVVVGVLTAILLLGAVVSVAVYFKMSQKAKPTRLTEVNMEEGETFTYRVDQRLEVHEGEVLTGTITALVGIRVINKTSEEYWFLMKIKVTVNKGDLDMKGMEPMKTDYFLVRLQISPRPSEASQANNVSEESFDLYGNRHTDKEIIRYVHGIIDQLLPAVKRDLYEDIDGEKKSAASELKPEVSSLFPGAVKMHRQAKTSDKNQVFIKNHFNRSDFVNMSSDLDLGIEYSDNVSINKSNGMVTESHAHLSEQLNFGTPIHTKSGHDVTMMNIFFSSHVSLIETDPFFFDDAELQTVNVQAFAKLVMPKERRNLTVDEKPKLIPVPPDSPSNSSARLSKRNVPARRHRRSLRDIWNILKPIFKSTPIIFDYELFKTELFGMDVKGKSKLWLQKKGADPLEIGLTVTVAFGKVAEVALINIKYDGNQISEGDTAPTTKKWSTIFTKEVPVWYILLGVEFTLSLELQVKVNFPAEENKLVPCLFALEIEPEAKAVASIKGYASAYFIRAGAKGGGTVVSVSLPLKFSFRIDRPKGQKWGLELYTRMTALDLSASIFYQLKWCQWSAWWWRFSCDWGGDNTLYDIGKLNGFTVNQKLLGKYF